jgi:acetyl esterase/lipase
VKHFRLLVCLGLIAHVTAPDALSENKPRTATGICYAEVQGQKLLLDLYLPAHSEAPLLVWIHGGAWRGGSRANPPLGFLVEQGYAVASIDYRLSPVAQFPAQVHDIKAAIRYLRSRQSEHGYNARRIGIVGSSAGGHLAALVGVSNGHRELEGKVGEHLDQSSDVQAIVDYYGPTNFLTILKQSTPHGLSVRVPALQLLLGGAPEEKIDLARLASPVAHVDPADPPLLMLHGDQDPQVPINQSHELQGAYKQHGLKAELEVVYGGAHGGAGFFDADRKRLVAEFLDKHVRGK